MGTILRERTVKGSFKNMFLRKWVMLGESELGRVGLRGAGVKVPGHLLLAGTLRVDTVF